MTTVWQAFERQVRAGGDRIAMTELRYPSGDRPEVTALTYRELHDWALAVAARLTPVVEPGETVLLFYATGLDFLAAFLGCLYAGIPAVPVPPPRRPYHRIAERISAIVDDAGVRVAATGPEVSVAELARLTPQLANLTWLDVNAERGERTGGPAGGPVDTPGDAIAYLQYTSGSTSVPKGVEVTHANLLEQVRVLDERFGHDADSTMVSWLPVFHDMGLIYTVLVPLMRGFPGVLMKPEDFVASPIRWLRAFTEYRGTHTMAPNFGYDLCVRKVPPALREGLNLSAWRVAANASEPVRVQTFVDFAREYEPYGLPPNAHRPAYGLAEATLIVSAVDDSGGQRWLPVDRGVLRGGQVRLTGGEVWDVASCGPALDGFDVRIVEPDTCEQLPEWTVGEVWVAGPCVARGYYRNAEATTATFRGRLADHAGTDYLRTGDLGFLAEGELFITGRRKDIIIVRGQNHYPQDIEHVAERAHPALRPGCGAAFVLDDADEQIALAYEARHEYGDADLAAAAAAVRTAVSETFGLRLHTVAFMPPGSVPKTSSGKIRRSASRHLLLAGDLPIRRSFVTSELASTVDEAAPRVPGLLRPALRRIAARVIGVAAGDIDDHTPLATYGLDSVQAAALAGEIERYLRAPVPETLVYDTPTVAGIAAALAQQP